MYEYNTHGIRESAYVTTTKQLRYKFDASKLANRHRKQKNQTNKENYWAVEQTE